MVTPAYVNSLERADAWNKLVKSTIYELDISGYKPENFKKMIRDIITYSLIHYGASFYNKFSNEVENENMHETMDLKVMSQLVHNMKDPIETFLKNVHPWTLVNDATEWKEIVNKLVSVDFDKNFDKVYRSMDEAEVDESRRKMRSHKNDIRRWMSLPYFLGAYDNDKDSDDGDQDSFDSTGDGDIDEAVRKYNSPEEKIADRQRQADNAIPSFWDAQHLLGHKSDEELENLLDFYKGQDQEFLDVQDWANIKSAKILLKKGDVLPFHSKE